MLKNCLFVVTLFICNLLYLSTGDIEKINQAQSRAHEEPWVHLCIAYGIFDTRSASDKAKHTGSALEQEIGKKGSKLILVGSGGHSNYEILARNGHVNEAKIYMKKIAIQYNWRLQFPNDATRAPLK